MPAFSPALFAGLPGATLISEGLADAGAGRVTVPACLVWIARPRLTRAGLVVNRPPEVAAEPERHLYHLLRLERGDAYSRYNALLRQLTSFVRALDRKVERDGVPLFPRRNCDEVLVTRDSVNRLRDETE